MMNAIAELGKFRKKRDGLNDPFDIWVEDSYNEANYRDLYLIELKLSSELENRYLWKYVGIDYQEHSSSLKNKLIYKKGSSRGCDITPVCKVNKGKLETAFNQNILGWFKENIKADFLSETEKYFLEGCFEELKKQNEIILGDLNEKIDSEKGFVLVLVFNKNGARTYPGDYAFFRKFISELSEEKYKYSKTYKVHSVNDNGTCSICNNSGKRVFGFFSSLAFYNTDKPGRISGGFNRSESWKNYPVCLDCALNTEAGIKELDESFRFSFYGLSYYLVPSMFNQDTAGDIYETISEFNRKQKINDKDEQKKRFLDTEEDIIYLLRDANNSVTLNLLFLKKNNSSLEILSSMEDVLPSRIRKLFEAKELVDNSFFTKFGKNNEYEYRFNFGIIRQFFPNSRIEGNKDKNFLEIIRSILCDSRIEYQFIIKNLINSIRSGFVSSEDIKVMELSTKSFMLLIYLDQLNMFRKKQMEGTTMNADFYKTFEINMRDEFDSKVNSFFDEFATFFETDAQRGVFLMGVLTRFFVECSEKRKRCRAFQKKT